MKSLVLLSLIGIFAVFSSCELPNSVFEESSVETLKESTYSINSYDPIYVEIGTNDDLSAKVRKDTTNSSAQRNIFNGILKRMNLDSTQTSIANELLLKHHNCVQSCLNVVKREENRILDSAKILRDSIKMLVDSSKISRVEASQKIKQLNSSVVRQLKTLNEKFKVKECMDICDREFIQSLLPILNPIQLDQFNKWIHHNRIGYPKKSKKDSIDRKRDTTKGRG